MKNLTIVCKDFDLTEAIKEYLEDKMSYLYKFFNCDETSINFNARIGKTSNHHNHGKIFYAEISIHTPEKNFGARVEAEEIYAAIDKIKDELARNITHYKDKTLSISRKQGHKLKQESRNIE
ncbi:MAG: ribosomal subunit interface protein [Pseudomonadota bacterium]|nr:ribosome-associated translation inhibitor RaiA [Burkholderiales bacterium]